LIIEIFLRINLGFLRVWSEICCVRPAIIAVCGITASIYLLQPVFSPCSPPHTAVLVLACFFILILTLLNLLSTRGSILWQNGAFYAKIVSLLLLISLGIYQLTRGNHDVFTSPFENTQTSIKKLSIAFYIGLFPYTGWNYLSNAVEELEKPERTFPIAIMSSIIASTVLYALAYSAYFTALTPYDVMTADAVAVTFAENIYRPFAFIMPLFVSISALGGLNGRMRIEIN
jgi:amino acid transporter